MCWLGASRGVLEREGWWHFFPPFFGGPKGGTNYLGVTGKIKTATTSNYQA